MQREGHREDAKKRLTRRGFLRASGSVTTALVLAACGAPPREEVTVGEMMRPVAVPILPSPVPATPVEMGGDPALEQFLALSSILTGYDNLNPVLGQVYLESIAQSSDYDMTVDELAQAMGLADAPSQTVADLEAAGLFDDPAAQTLADAIITMWYTGVYTTAEGEQQVATFVDALVWRAMAFTKPLSICASPGFWAQAPQQPFA